MEEITLDQALELLKYPYKFCDINKKDVMVCKGKYGVYIKYGGKNISLGELKEKDITRKIIKELITNGGKKKTNEDGKVNNITIDDDIVIKNGKFGYYINFEKKNIGLKYSKHFKSLNITPENLTKEDCDKIIREYNEYKSKKK